MRGIAIALPPSTFWVNKRGVALIDLPLPHDLRSRPDGWEIEFTAAGRLVLRLLQGAERPIDVRVGDRLVSRGEEMYLALKP